jgi:hypothetical protein
MHAPHQILLPQARLHHKSFTQSLTVTCTYPYKPHTECTKHLQLSLALSTLAFSFPFSLSITPLLTSPIFLFIHYKKGLNMGKNHWLTSPYLLHKPKTKKSLKRGRDPVIFAST